MNRKIYYLLLISTILILSGYYSIHKLTKGNFEFEPSPHYENIKEIAENQVYYLGYNLYWNGRKNPTIEKIELYTDNEEEEYNNFAAELFIDTKGSFISATEDIYILLKESDFIHFILPDHYPVENKRCKVVAKIDTKYKEELKKIKTLQVTYKILWLTKKQTFDIDLLKIHTIR